jgi:competence protein ComEA
MNIKYNKKVIGSIVILVVLTIFLAVGFFINKPKEHKVDEDDIFVDAPVTTEPVKIESKVITVFINGEVKNPGVYRLKPGSIVEDLVKAAGGVTEEANINSKLNLAKKLKDEDYVYIDNKNTVNPMQTSTVSVSNGNLENGKININTASLEELDKIPGVGPITAQKIIDYRESNGGFNALEDLKNIDGIGEKTFANFKDKIDIR